jgi:hypothetical protein
MHSVENKNRNRGAKDAKDLFFVESKKDDSTKTIRLGPKFVYEYL